MHKYLVLYEEKGFWFSYFRGMELIEAESWEKAYEKLTPRFKLRMMRQVNDDAQPQDFRPYDIEEEHRHEEQLARFKASLNPNKETAFNSDNKSRSK